MSLQLDTVMKKGGEERESMDLYMYMSVMMCMEGRRLRKISSVAAKNLLQRFFFSSSTVQPKRSSCCQYESEVENRYCVRLMDEFTRLGKT